jgi:hypothetical protein
VGTSDCLCSSCASDCPAKWMLTPSCPLDLSLRGWLCNCFYRCNRVVLLSKLYCRNWKWIRLNLWLATNPYITDDLLVCCLTTMCQLERWNTRHTAYIRKILGENTHANFHDIPPVSTGCLLRVLAFDLCPIVPSSNSDGSKLLFPPSFRWHVLLLTSTGSLLILLIVND